jgi:hypothetical protein
MNHASTSDALLDQLINEYNCDFEIPFENVMSLFLGMEIEQSHNRMAIEILYLRN